MTSELRVQWGLGNSCKLDCDYCHIELKDGTNPFPAIDILRPAFVHLLEQARAFSSIKVEISGGEPTESNALREIMLDNTSDNIKFQIVSNAQADLIWWQTVANKLYQVELTYHTSTDLSHFISVVSTLKDRCSINISVAHTPDNWGQAFDAYLKIKQLVTNTKIQLLYKNFIKGNNQYLDYTSAQWDTYFKEIGVDPNKPKEVADTSEYKKIHLLNKFYGHLCHAGYSQIIIDNFGYVYRGWCKSNGHMGNVFDKSFILDSRPRPCPKQQCTNGFDLQAHKSEGTWGIA